MTFQEQDQLAAEIGTELPCNPVQDEAIRRSGYNPLQDTLRHIHPALRPIVKGFFTAPMTCTGVYS
jgi:hypothetical protein